ncbi:DUF4386 domain-containing protein [Actinoplanes sp. NPDC049265]|uniref:DUF4386 domain-containing protein n=1 Tax=Actinoplanes sp. NPDC049265 TaxID=3363902 RepID=UPI00371547BA
MMNPVRRTSIATGVLFLLATVAALAAGAVVPVLTGPDAPTGLAGQHDRLAAAALLYLVAAGTSVGIAVALYPLLKTLHAGLALGSVVFRTIEAVFYAVAVVALLSLRSIAEPSVADSVISMRDSASVVGVLAFCTGALMYYVVFYRSRLVPRWLSGWGMVGVFLMAVACLLALFSGNPVTGYTLLALPIGVQEMVLAVWLLARGFSQQHIVAGAASD